MRGDEHTQIVRRLCSSIERLGMDRRRVQSLEAPSVKLRSKDAAVLLGRSQDQPGRGSVESGGSFPSATERSTGRWGKWKRESGSIRG